MSQEQLLSKRFPLVFDDHQMEHYYPLPCSLVPFLRKLFGRKSQYRELVLDLFQLVAHEGGTVATISDRKLAERLEMDRRDVQDAAADPTFMSLVGVWRGKKRVKGEEPDATDYDLAPLLQLWREYRVGAEPPEGWGSHFSVVAAERTYWITVLMTAGPTAENGL